jgi:hypothetical protein
MSTTPRTSNPAPLGYGDFDSAPTGLLGPCSHCRSPRMSTALLPCWRGCDTDGYREAASGRLRAP